MLSLARDLTLALDPVAFAQAAGIEPDPWQANALANPPRRGLWCCSRQSGKTTTAATKALHVAAFEPGALIILVAPAQRQSAELLRTIRLLHGKVDGLPELRGDSVLRIEMENGSRILALPGDGGGKTIRGLANARLVIVDEAARVDDELFASVRPMLATNRDGAMILLSTPAGRRGAFYELWHNNDPTWTRVRVPASECPRIDPEFLAEERRELGEARYSEEYQLAFIDSDTSAFSTAIIDSAFTNEVLPLWT
jgi:Terminase large subunit, T4likevirus-type, N-terminal